MVVKNDLPKQNIEITKLGSTNMEKKTNRSSIPRNTAYFFGKVSQALQILATSEEDIKGRLIGAGEYFLCVDPEGVPEELREDVKWVQDQLTRFEAIGDEGSLRATMRKIQKRTGVKIAKRIVYIYFKFTDYVKEPSIQNQDSNDVSSTETINEPPKIIISF